MWVTDAVMKRCCLFALLALLLFVSCNNKQKVKKPEVFLTEQQMIDVLSDSYLIEAELTQKKSSGIEVAALQKEYYDQLFAHYGINDSIFEENMYYYTHQLPTLERIMDSVSNRFLKMQNAESNPNRE